MDLDHFYLSLRDRARPVVIDVWAPWCLPCRSISPALEQLGRQYSGRVDVWKINADENPALMQALGIRGIPTLLVFQGEREIMRSTGAQPLSALARLFEAALSGAAPERRGPAPFDRILRAASGLALLGLAWTGELPVLWLLLGGMVLFSAVYDRCPLWRVITARLSRFAEARKQPAR